MGWFNTYGLILMILIMLPNVIFSIKRKEAFDNVWHNRTIEIFEQIGRFGCFIFMIINIPYTWSGFWFYGASTVYILVNLALVAIYCVIWIVCFNKNSIFKALALSILPAVIFFFSGIMLLSVPLIIASAIFAACHITISYKNAVLSEE